MKKGILVTTEWRGVFFGYVNLDEGQEVNFFSPEIELENARCCVYWDATVKGFLGLAQFGPNNKCRIGPRVPKLHLRGVTSVAEATEAAVKAWEKEHWG